MRHQHYDAILFLLLISDPQINIKRKKLGPRYKRNVCIIMLCHNSFSFLSFYSPDPTKYKRIRNNGSGDEKR